MQKYVSRSPLNSHNCNTTAHAVNKLLVSHRSTKLVACIAECADFRFEDILPSEAFKSEEFLTLTCVVAITSGYNHHFFAWLLIELK